MARLASQAKGGYYPTPPAQMELVAARVAVQPGQSLNLLDPCAGRGEALRLLADRLAEKGALVKTCGVELERERAEDAARLLDAVVKGGYEYLRCSRGVMSALWLNPPYDDNGLGGRVEVDFFADLTRPDGPLAPGALVMYCIPQESLAAAAAYLAVRLENLAVYRFTDRDYPAFRQVVVFGRRGKSRRGPEVRAEKERLLSLARAGPEALPPLDAPDGVTFAVPAAPGPVTLFRGSVLDPEEIARDVAASPLWERLPELLLPESRRVGLKRPLLPLKLAHLALVIAAGAVDGAMGDHYLEGTTRKVVDRVEEDNGDGQVRVIEVERHVTVVRVFDRGGVHELS